jgi:CHASE3 domain sensor protein
VRRNRGAVARCYPSADTDMLEFDRRYVLLPVLLGVAFVVAAYLVTESGREARIEGVTALQRAQERSRLLAELQLSTTDAESAQRGFLLTGNDEYLIPYQQSKRKAEQQLDELRAAYDTSEQPIKQKARELGNVVTTKFTELDVTRHWRW